MFSDGERLKWVLLNQADLPLASAKALGEAFNRFPYLTQKETNALACCCSLHPDQVRVWFIVQRLCHGIIWDYTDIMAVQSKLKSKQGKEEPQQGVKKEMKADSRVEKA
ncbi:homeobox and leucine zipper encoding b isoform X3 [Xyrichtys novacula]|uniref:Homeobox and leucine zipper encoding b isoform X3 n=1 Tax=Xyrichtys novacula TaxID=13765 RepID=A0AAV1HLF1_XYRNO|nr:homeobox and leucine zipper encoding b isoform X3 [Xyrichtys novacula]